MTEWKQLKAGDRIELGLLQLDIAGHSKFDESEHILQRSKAMFRSHIQGLMEIRGGRLFNWAGDGGAFMFLTEREEGFENLVFSGLPSSFERATVYQ